MKFYAGIGSRDTPDELETVIRDVALVCNEQGYVLRSGGAPGADTMFEKYAAAAEIYLPKPGWRGHMSSLHTPSPEAREIAARHHPAWHRCNEFARKLHARNSHQILGENLDSPVDFVVCWTPGGQEIGGTSQALRVARHYGIWIENLWPEKTQQNWIAMARKLTVR